MWVRPREFPLTMLRPRLASGSERSYERRAKYLRISVQIYDNAICVFYVLDYELKQ